MNGLLCINKNKKCYTYDIIRHLKRLWYPQKIKVGHFGTLDPGAVGLVIVGIGKATKLQEKFLKYHKKYIALGEFGKTSDTLDITGIVENTNSIIKPNTGEMINVINNNFLGEIYQQIPQYSAVKVNGKRLYKYALENIDVELPVKKKTIFSINILYYKFPFFLIEIECSSGTYVRQLIFDIGKKLNCSAVTHEIIRISIGPYKIDIKKSLNDVTLNPIISKYLSSVQNNDFNNCVNVVVLDDLNTIADINKYLIDYSIVMAGLKPSKLYTFLKKKQGTEVN